MLARIKELRKNEEGFTLIELMVVVLIIGVLAAIAIPVFLNLQKEGIKAGVKSDVKNTVTNVASFLASKPTASTVNNAVLNAAGYKVVESDGNSVTVLGNWNNYTVQGQNITGLGSDYSYTFSSTTGKNVELP